MRSILTRQEEKVPWILICICIHKKYFSRHCLHIFTYIGSWYLVLNLHLSALDICISSICICCELCSICILFTVSCDWCDIVFVFVFVYLLYLLYFCYFCCFCCAVFVSRLFTVTEPDVTVDQGSSSLLLFWHSPDSVYMYILAYTLLPRILLRVLYPV